MNQTLPQHVISLSCNHNGQNHHKSRQRVGYHVYLPRSFYDFKILSKEEQEVALVEGGV